MGQYKSFNENHIESKIASLEDEVIRLKAKQIYGMNDVEVFTSNEQTQTGHTFTMKTYDEQHTGTGYATNILKIRFVGNKPSKTVVGILKWKWQIISQGEQPADVAFIKNYRGSSPNVLEWLVCAYGGANFPDFPASFSTFNVTFTALTNEVGVLSIVESYDIGSYYHWILG